MVYIPETLPREYLIGMGQRGVGNPLPVCIFTHLFLTPGNSTEPKFQNRFFVGLTKSMA
jgi:hypothetical protein